jgi:AcrR family transcriptional regulator
MAKKSDLTKGRLLTAATAEFAARGIAGARVDRIAADAAVNKNLIYVYFGSKEQLFDAVYNQSVTEFLEAIAFDAHDLPGYAGALFDYFHARPELIRLARWHSLERSGAIPMAEQDKRTKVQALAQAQAAGVVNAGMAPEDLLTLVLTVARAWSDGAPESAEEEVGAAVTATRRHAIVVAVGTFTRPPETGHPSEDQSPGEVGGDSGLD